jgi:hypothetical protein
VANENGLSTPFDNDLKYHWRLEIKLYDGSNRSIVIRMLMCSRRTFFPSGIDERSTSTLAMAKTSADADMFTKKSAENRGVSMLIPLQLSPATAIALPR